MKDRIYVDVAIYAALVAVLGLIPPVPFMSGIPITAQTLGVMLAGVMLGPKRAFLAMAVFLLAVAAGFPLLSGGRGGLAVFTGPTAGFALAFPFSAMVTGFIMQSLRKVPVFAAALIASVLGGIVFHYLPGIAGFKLVSGNSWSQSALTMIVFIPGDIIKALLSAVIAKSISQALPGVVRTRQQVK